MHDSYLVHHGIKGQKWGVRRFQNEDGSLTSKGRSRYDIKTDKLRSKADKHIDKIGSSKTRLGKTYHNYMAYNNEFKANTRDSWKADKGHITKRVGDIIGSGYSSNLAKATSGYYDRKSEYTKTKLGTTVAKAQAYNQDSLAKAANKLHNSKNVLDYGSNYINAIATRPIKTLAGRETTTGKRMVDAALTGGYLGLAKDVKYYMVDNKEKGTIARNREARRNAK